MELVKKGAYGLTYKEVYLMDNLTIEAKAIYGMLCSYAGSGATAYPSVEFMCKKLHISNTRFYKHMNLLIGAGIVEKSQIKGENGNFTNNVYTLVPNLQNIQNPYTQNGGMENEYTDNGGMENKGTNNNNTKSNSIKNNNKKSICSDSAEPSPKQIKKSIPPTLEEVQQYCKERNNSVDAQSFIDFYESKGWMIGKNKMKDWKAAVRTWERNCRQQVQEETFPQRPEYKHDFDIILPSSPDDPFK